MGSQPNIGKRILSSRAEDLLHAPEAESLGRISADALEQITSEPPPPWESDPRYHRHDTDARRFVKVPDNWELRWLSPRVIQVSGMRDWQAVAGNDSRVTVLNKSLIAPDNTIRRGGDMGDILCWMYKSWVESRNRIKAGIVARKTGEARDRQDAVREQINRGSYGPYISMDSAKHPTHTIGDGRSMKD